MNFNELDSFLSQFHSGAEAAECHGFLTGYLCIKRGITAEIWSEYLLAGKDVENAETNECDATFQALSDEIVEQLHNPEFGFELLLPDEDADIEMRGLRLGEWCQGFLSGMGVELEQNHMNLLSAECQELFQDLSQITRIGVDDQLDDEESEVALTEIIEYVRMGVLMIHDEMGLIRVGDSEPRVIH